MPLRIDDPFEFFQDMPDDIQQQLRAQIPELDDLPGLAFEPDSAQEDAFGFGDFARSVLDNLNPNANFMSNAWSVGTGIFEDAGFDLGVIGSLNPRANLQTNVWNVARDLSRDIDFGSLFGGSGENPPGNDEIDAEMDQESGGTTTLFLPNGDPVQVSDAMLSEESGQEAPKTATNSAGAVTGGVEDMVSSLFEQVLGSALKVRELATAGSAEEIIAQGVKRLAQRAIQRAAAALAA